ncbi:MAG: haloacid dehalogenase type II [Pseudomonadota bacterium]
MTISTVIFDAYGTLFDVDGAAKQAASEAEFQSIADIWPKLSADWRSKQLQYAWLRTLMETYSDFWQVTEDALDWAMEAHNVTDPGLRARLLQLYRTLPAYPEVPQMLAELKAAGVTCAVLSNGNSAMLADAIGSAGLDTALDAALSIDEIGIYKPARRAYDLVAQRLGARPDETFFVSSNGWDVAGAASFGFETLWVNRAGAPVDRLAAGPAQTATDLSGLPELIQARRGRHMVTESPTQFLTLPDGMRIAFKDEGTGPALLCLAGLTRTMADFDFVARDFSDRARIIRVDLRGRGESAYDPDYKNYNTICESRDILALLDHLAIDKVAILGTSRGGLIALTLAVGHVERLSGVCLVDVGPEIEPEGLAFIFSYLGQKTECTTLDDMAAELQRKNAGRFPDVPVSRWRLQASRNWAETGGPLQMRYDPALRKAVLEQSAGDAIPDLWPLFDAFEGIPLALIRGENSDVLSKDTAARMRERRPDMIFGEVPNRGHVPFLDEPEAQKVISDFLDLLAKESAPSAA